MNLQRFRILLQKEVCYIERDWRTLLAMFGIPLVFYPLILLEFVVLGAIDKHIQSEEAKTPPRQVVKVATLQVPDDSPLLKLLRNQKHIEMVPSKHPMKDLDDGKCDTVIEMPEQANEILRKKGSLVLKVWYDTDPKVTHKALWDLLKQYPLEELRVRLGNPSLSSDYLQPVVVEYQSVTSKPTLRSQTEKFEKYGKPVSGVLGVLCIVIVCIVNFPFFLEERTEGTLETLLSTPVRRLEILLAKWWAILVFTVIQVAVYAGVTFHVIRLYNVFKAAGLPAFSLTTGEILLSAACLFQLAMFFYALSLVICTFAQSHRETSNLVSITSIPLMILAIMPLLLPSDPSPSWLALPASNLACAMRAILRGSCHLGQWYAAIFSNLFYIAALIWTAGRLLDREPVLFGGTSELRLTFRRSQLAPRPRPSGEEVAVFCGLAFFLMLYVAVPLQAHDLVSGLLLTLVGIFLLLPLGLAIYLKLDICETFRFRVPSPRAMASTVLLWAGWMVAAPSLVGFQNRILPMPAELAEAMHKLLTGLGARYSLAAILGFGAVLPGICEEMAFRGFILSGLAGRWRARWAVLATALVFALIHCDPWRFIPTFILGVLMGVLTVRSGSIIPAMLFHALNNGAMLWIGTRLGDATQFSKPQFLVVSALAGLMVMAVALALLFEIRRTPRKAGE